MRIEELTASVTDGEGREVELTGGQVLALWQEEIEFTVEDHSGGRWG